MIFLGRGTEANNERREELGGREGGEKREVTVVVAFGLPQKYSNVRTTLVTVCLTTTAIHVLTTRLAPLSLQKEPS